MDKLFNDVVEVSDDSFILFDDFLGLLVLFLKLSLESLDFALLLDQLIAVKIQLEAILILMHLQISFAHLLQKYHQNFIIFLYFGRGLAHISGQFFEVIVQFVLVWKQLPQMFFDFSTVVCFRAWKVMHSNTAKNIVHKLDWALLLCG